MFGFFIGALSLAGLIYVLRRSGGCYGGHRGRWGYARGRRGFLHFVFEALDTSPGQEKEIRSALDELFEGARGMRDELKQSRQDVAEAMRSEFFDETRMGESFARQDDGLDKLRRTVVGALAKVHAVLDDNQRRRLAELIEQGPYRAWHFGQRGHA
jgi:uncharacterized membrane protein